MRNLYPIFITFENIKWYKNIFLQKHVEVMKDKEILRKVLD